MAQSACLLAIANAHGGTATPGTLYACPADTSTGEATQTPGSSANCQPASTNYGTVDAGGAYASANDAIVCCTY
jgi:hypothetical protein